MTRLAPLALLTACAWEPPTQADLDPAWTDCSAGQTCVIVELGVCDACNGGALVAVNEASEDAVLRRHAQPRPIGRPYSCTLMACAPVTAVCEDDVCVPVQGSFDDE